LGKGIDTVTWQLAVVFALPLLTTIVSGILFTIGVEWFHQQQLAEVLMRIHTLQLFGLGNVFPLLIGVGLIGLLMTRLSMTNLFQSCLLYVTH
jgi:hypothetical protein